jgi:hypothetical protein
MFPMLAAVSLLGMEGLLVKVTNSAGTPKAALPAAQNDLALHLVIQGAASGELADLLPLSAEQQVRIRLNGTCNPGDKLVLDVGAEADYGKVKKLPATAGTYLVIGDADEAGVDEQLLLVRPNPRLVTVAAAHIADAAQCGAQYAQGEANATVDKLNAILAVLEGAGIVAAA